MNSLKQTTQKKGENMTGKAEAAKKTAEIINKQLKKTGVQLCNYSRRFLIKKGAFVTSKGDSIYINGKGAALLIGSFKAYEY